MDRKEPIPESIVAGRRYCHAQSPKGIADFHVAALPHEPALVLNQAYLSLRPMLERWQLFRNSQVTSRAASGWRCHSQALMRLLEDTNPSTAVENFLAKLHVSEGVPRQQFDLPGHF